MPEVHSGRRRSAVNGHPAGMETVLETGTGDLTTDQRRVNTVARQVYEMD
jgi:hypothetical protein